MTVVARAFPGQPTTETIDGVRFHRTRGFSQGGSVGWDLVKDFAYAWNALPRLPAADILVTNDFWLPVLAARFRPAAGAVVVSAGRFPKGQYRLYRGAARIVAISSAVKAAVAAERPDLDGRTVVLPLPVDLDLFASAKGAKGAGKRLLYAGRIHPEKGLELLIGAYARLAESFPEWELELVGPVAEAEGGGGEPFLRRLHALARGRKVGFRGAIFDPETLAAVYRSADLFCYPSLAEHGEAFGVAALESMAAGVPPVVSDLSCFRDFVRDGENGWVFDHRDSAPEERLAGVLARTMGDEEFRHHAGAAALEEAAKYSFPAVAKAYLAEFDRVVSERARPSQR